MATTSQKYKDEDIETFSSYHKWPYLRKTNVWLLNLKNNTIIIRMPIWGRKLACVKRYIIGKVNTLLRLAAARKNSTTRRYNVEKDYRPGQEAESG